MWRNKTLRIVPPSQDRRELLNQPMQECLGDILEVQAAWPTGQALLVARHETGHH